MNRIDQVLDCMALPELPVGELAPERISGITERTLELVHTKTKTRAPRRTLRGVFAAAAAAAVLFLSDGALFGSTLYIVKEIGRSMGAGKGNEKRLVPICGVLGALLAFLAGREPKIGEVIGQEILPWMSAGLGILVPAVVWVLRKERRREGLSCGREKGKTEDVVDGKETEKRSEKNEKRC